MKTTGATAKIGEGIYTAADAARILKIPYSKANYWFKYYLKNKHFKTDYRYYFEVSDILAVNFLTLIEMYVFYAFKEESVKIADIIIAHETISKTFDTPYPFANKDFYVSGRKIYYGDDKDLTIANKTKQKMLADILIQFSKKIEYGNANLAHKYYPLGKNKSIVVDPENQFGQPVIEGTNIRVETIYNFYKAGDSIELICELYNISNNNVKDAIEFFSMAA
ncbi:MAG: DUF433 domain-containing protein [Bacteroidia bacterium]